MPEANLTRYREARQALLHYQAAEAASDTEPTAAVAAVWRNLETELERIRTRHDPEHPNTRRLLTEKREAAAVRLGELMEAVAA